MCGCVSVCVIVYGYLIVSVYVCVFVELSEWVCALDRNLCQDICFLSGSKKQDCTNQKNKISGRYDEFARCNNRQDYT